MPPAATVGRNATSMSTTSSYFPTVTLQQPLGRASTPKRSLRKASYASSTPNLNSAYQASAQEEIVPPVPTHAPHRLRIFPSTSNLARKSSLATLTENSLASIPDGGENYVLESVLSDDRKAPAKAMPPSTPGRYSEDVAVGDVVDVPGGMVGTVRFVGTVAGKKGSFAGVELHSEFSGRGKNSGDVEGVSYFSPSIPGAGIFLPMNKAMRRESGTGSIMSAYPMTPTPSNPNGLKAGNQNSTNFTPPTPGLPKFSASMGPGARAPSPSGRRSAAPRTSLPRPDSPVRRSAMTPGPRPSLGGGGPGKTPSRYGSPTNRLAQSVRGTSGDPSKKMGHKPSLGGGPRSASALGFDDDAAPNPGGLQRTTTSGSVGSLSSFKRPASRAHAGNEEELERLRSQLQERDRQLREQGATLSEMESSLTELQSLMDGQEGPLANGAGDGDSAQLRTMLRDKNEKIAMLTAEFDAHRADFRSTIDTLEMASTETERVYEKRIEELMGDVRELESRNLDVDSVANQLKQLEELVQELEEGLEDARRGEAEARGEVEFLRGEVERTRTELRREREKEKSGSPNGSRDRGGSSSKEEKMISSKEMEQKEDEIRGLKAIIHSLSRDSIPSAETRRMSMGHRGSSSLISNEAVDNKIARDNLERQVAELQAMLEKRSSRQQELERELDHLKRASFQTSNPTQRSSLRDSRDTVILNAAAAAAAAAASKPQSPETRKRSDTLDIPENDTHSIATETSTLWCEICETGGHDILTCTNMFGSEAKVPKTNGQAGASEAKAPKTNGQTGASDARPAPLSPMKRSVSPMAPAVTKVMPNPMESGPVPGKESGVIDAAKWCAVCERDGHDSVDCPFEDAF